MARHSFDKSPLGTRGSRVRGILRVRDNSLDRYRAGSLLYRYRHQEVVMELLPLAMLIGSRQAHDTARSALPHAPVVDEPSAARRRAARPRRRSAVLLLRRLTLATDSRARGARWDESPCRPSPTT